MTDKEMVYKLIKSMNEDIYIDSEDKIQTEHHIFEFLSGRLVDIFEL